MRSRVCVDKVQLATGSLADKLTSPGAVLVSGPGLEAYQVAQALGDDFSVTEPDGKIAVTWSAINDHYKALKRVREILQPHYVAGAALILVGSSVITKVIVAFDVPPTPVAMREVTERIGACTHLTRDSLVNAHGEAYTTFVVGLHLGLDARRVISTIEMILEGHKIYVSETKTVETL